MTIRIRPRPARRSHAGAGRALLAALLAMLPAPLAAQYGAPPAPPPDLPTSSSPQQQAPPAVGSPAEVLRAAACLIERDGEAATPLLGSAPYSSAEREQAVRALRAAERCLRMRERMSTSVMALRGAMAEELYERRFAEPAAPRDPPLASAAFFRADAATTRDDAAALAPTYELAGCTAARRPELVRALLASDPESAGEGAALQALSPVFGECVAPGTTLSIERAAIRAILAESLYRWSVVQRDGPASPWAAAAPAPAN